MLFSVVLVFYYYRRVTPGTVISGVMKMLSYSSLFLILLFLFYISLRVLPKRYGHTFGIQIVTAVFTAFFIILVLTNDKFIFKFKPVFSDWNNDYFRTWLFYVINIWQYFLYAAAVIILIKMLYKQFKKECLDHFDTVCYSIFLILML